MLGEGAYADDDVFDALLKALVRRLESNTVQDDGGGFTRSRKTTGHASFARMAFSVSTDEIHNSLHSRTPGGAHQRRCSAASAAARTGVETMRVEGDDEFRAFMKLLKAYNVPKVKRWCAHESFFRGMAEAGDGQPLITRYRERVIGCSALVFSNGNALTCGIWLSAARALPLSIPTR